MISRFFVVLSFSLGCLYAGEAPLPRVEIPADTKSALEKSLAELTREIAAIRADVKENALLDLLPDVQIFANAVRFALEDNTFYANAKTGKSPDFDNMKK